MLVLRDSKTGRRWEDKNLSGIQPREAKRGRVSQDCSQEWSRVVEERGRKKGALGITASV